MSNGNGVASMAAMTLAGTGPATVKADQTRAFEPGSIGEGYRLAELLVKSGLLGRNVTRPEQAFAIIATGRELGLTAMQSLRSVHIIEGKPTLSADLIAALCKSRPDVCVYFRMVESTPERAVYETQRKGEPSPTRMTWTIQQANAAGVANKDNWRRYPDAMLRARCITALARAVYPDLAMGIYDPDEVESAPTMPAPPYEVVPPAPAAPVDERAYQDLCERVDAAESAAQLNAAASATAKAHKSRRITDEQLATIRDAVTRKRTLIGAPKAPASAPPSSPDQDPHNGDDDEALGGDPAGEHD